MPFAYFERDLWDLRDHDGRETAPGVPETGRWLLDYGAVDQLADRRQNHQLAASPRALLLGRGHGYRGRHALAQQA